MTITYPLSLPSVGGLTRLDFRAVQVVGESASPFSGSQQVYAHPGEWWEAEATVAPTTDRATAEAWLAWLVSLRGKFGTFLLPPPYASAPRGEWGTPLVNGTNAAGARTLAIDGLAIATTAAVKAGDWFHLGSGTSTRLYKVLADANSNGSGEATLDIWPALRTAPANNDPLTIRGVRGLFRLSINNQSWTLDGIINDGIVVPCREAL